jgi:2-polyprenyl-3-methyl-5-hydroxy-6-metoxy-1,4-benzoquinol methylase
MNRNIGTEVLEFYRKLPFNVYENHKIAINNIKNSDVLSYYTPLKEIIKKNEIKSIIDIGCGGGWFLNSLAFQLGDNFNYHGVDFNQIAINHGTDISKRMNLNVTYENQPPSGFSQLLD